MTKSAVSLSVGDYVRLNLQTWIDCGHRAIAEPAHRAGMIGIVCSSAESVYRGLFVKWLNPTVGFRETRAPDYFFVKISPIELLAMAQSAEIELPEV